MAKKRTKKTAPAEPATDASIAEGETPVDYMLRVMRDPKAAPGRRDTMAKSATPYLHRRPAAKKKRANGGDASLKKRLETARETLAGKIALLRSDSD
jgi:hypothetical protein